MTLPSSIGCSHGLGWFWCTIVTTRAAENVTNWCVYVASLAVFCNRHNTSSRECCELVCLCCIFSGILLKDTECCTGLSQHWKHSELRAMKKFKKFSGMSKEFCWWTFNPKGQTTNAVSFCNVLVKLRDVIRLIRPKSPISSTSSTSPTDYTHRIV